MFRPQAISALLAATIAMVALVGIAMHVDALAVASTACPILRVVPPSRALEARADTRVHRNTSDTTDGHLNLSFESRVMDKPVTVKIERMLYWMLL